MLQPQNLYLLCYTEGVRCRGKKRLSNSSESAQLADCGDPYSEMVAVLNVIITPKVKALLILVTSSELISFLYNFLIVSIPQIRLHPIDGFSPSYIMHTTDISVQFPCRTIHQARFVITKLDTKFPAVLRLDWLTLHNSLIN